VEFGYIKMKISFIKTENIELSKLYEFQGELKQLSKENYNKLRKSMFDNGFAEPFVVWEDKKENKIYVVGGNQRLRVLSGMKNAGEEIPSDYPCNFVECESRWHAKKLLLALASQYGQITQDGLYEFSMENDFNIDFLNENFNFPGLDLELFKIGYFGDGNLIDEKNPGQTEYKDMPAFEQEDISAYKILKVHFRNQKDVDTFSKLINQNINENTRFIWHPKLERQSLGNVKTA